MKADENISAEEVKEFDKRIKHIKAVYDEYEKVKYTIPYSHFRTLAKGLSIMNFSAILNLSFI